MTAELQKQALLEKLSSGSTKEDSELIWKALAHLEKLNQKTFQSQEKVGENISVAGILSDMKADASTIAAALLCSKMLSNDDFAEIKKDFGEETAHLIENKIRFENAIKAQKKIQNGSLELRKILFFSLANNINLMLFVLADRLNLLRKIKALSAEEANDLITEQKEIMLPLAHKLGVFGIISEAEDTIFLHTDQKKYREILEKSEKEARARKKEIEKITELLTEKAKERNISIKISGRAKSIYSTYRKMQAKNKSIEEIHDIIALRVLCDSVKDCYEVLGIVHSLWRPIQEEFDDYITKPKENNYQALHTTVMGSENKCFEMQIKTKEMHNMAEFGTSAHWKYRGVEEQKMFDKKINWLNQLLSWRKDLKEAPKRTAKVDFFGENIYVLSPKGDMIELPHGASVLDFAYTIHDDIGNKCSKAKVNQKPVTLNHKLETGDIVEIITSFSQKPKMNWLGLVITIKAKNSIRKALQFPQTAPKKTAFAGKSAIKITDKRIKIAQCCTPVPGDKIVGFRTTKRKISVHHIDCREILKFPHENQTNVSWDPNKKGDYEVGLQITANDRVGLLKDILEVLTTNNITVIDAKAKLKGETANCSFHIETKNLSQLEKTIDSLRAVNSVITVERI